ncbi:hypothetical protein JX266_008943 [Neoarthrinium moseri]|nr:hypothetical protein JX266_008943 [Neoarthrinium moseri]
MEWYDLSEAPQIQWTACDSPNAKWGWVIFRCSYKPELAGIWEGLETRIVEESRRFIAESDAPDIVEKLDWVLVEDPALEDASREELKRRFRTWAITESPTEETPPPDGASRCARYAYFIQIDEEALSSLTSSSGSLSRYGYVNIVQGWKDPLPPEEATNELGSPVDNEDWMHVEAGMVAPYFYNDLDGNGERWYVHYSPPPDGVCDW